MKINKILFIDEEISTDKRVLKNLSATDIDKNFIVNCNSINTKIKYNFLFFFQVLKNMVFNALPFYKVKTKYGITFNFFLIGIKNSIHNLYKSYIFYKQQLHKYDIELIFSNNLYCGFIGSLLKNENNKLIYDSHEIQFHRNRKNSFIRSLIDFAFEKEVIKKADEVRVVNLPIKYLYMDIYGVDENKINVVNNNHFELNRSYYKKYLKKVKKPSVLYIGGGIKGRMLEELAKEAKSLDIKVYAYFINEIPEFINGYDWNIGDKNYIEDLKALIQKETLLMWCVNDTSCLSYKLALPNKFFQAVAFGIPVIVYRGTYMEKVVNKYKIGYIYENNLQEITSNILNKPEDFKKIIENMNNFQDLIYNKKLIL